MKKYLIVAMAALLAACGDSTAPQPIVQTAVLSFAKCGSATVDNVLKTKYDVAVTLNLTFGAPWRAWFIKNTGTMATDTTDANRTKQSGCIYLSGDRASVAFFLNGERNGTLTSEILLPQ